MRGPTGVTKVAATMAGVAGMVLRASLTLAGAVIVGFAIPAVWLWASGTLIASIGAGTVSFLVAVVALVGVVASYVALVWVVGLLAARRQADEPPPRFAWNRSLGGERHEPLPLNALERVFIAAVLLAGVGYTFWFFVFAGPPLPLS